MKPKRRRPGIEELLAVFNSLSDKDAGRLCDYILGVEIGTISWKCKIMPYILYDAAVRPLQRRWVVQSRLKHLTIFTSMTPSHWPLYPKMWICSTGYHQRRKKCGGFPVCISISHIWAFLKSECNVHQQARERVYVSRIGKVLTWIWVSASVRAVGVGHAPHSRTRKWVGSSTIG